MDRYTAAPGFATKSGAAGGSSLESALDNMTILSVSDKGQLTLISSTPRGQRQGRANSGLQLTWPRANDTRRAFVIEPPPDLVDGPGLMYLSDARFIHTSSSEIELYQASRNSGPHRRSYVAPPLRMPLDWNPRNLKLRDKELIEHFRKCASQALATFGSDRNRLGDSLIRLGLGSDTPTGVAVLKALLAFSSIHRDGVQVQAGNLKISALKALSLSVGMDDLSSFETVQQLAASMLLYSFEIHKACCTSGQWTSYLLGVNSLLSALLRDEARHDEIPELQDWAYYNTVMAQFTLRYWSPPSPDQRMLPPQAHVNSARTDPDTALLRQMSDIFISVGAPRRSSKESKDYAGFVKVLEWRIHTIPVTDVVTELYRLASLIFLARTESSPSFTQLTRTQVLVDKAFRLLAGMSSCERQFPVFILGCEARSDPQRAVILDLISRTECLSTSRSFTYVKYLLQAIWAQNDLQEGDVDYSTTLSSTFRRCAVPPVLV
ncbi:hypothetical protein GGR57DRAFT_466227 [Xylariaceae sp. FL1272]|nr:hypothetical protein GGR57DRAFT_466227 [Xylariaceae sp. FL1272]